MDIVKIGMDRMCEDHRTNIQAKIASACKFVEMGGMRVPVSPDGIPMINLAKPIQDPEANSDDNSSVNSDNADVR